MKEDDNKLVFKTIYQQKLLSCISIQDYFHNFPLLQISNTHQTTFKPVQNISSDLVERRCAVMIATTPQNEVTQ